MEPTKSSTEKAFKLDDEKRRSRSRYWEHLLNQYEKKNATLEKRQAALAERVKFMECALPSLLMGAVFTSSQEPGSSRSSSNTRDRIQQQICEEYKLKD